MKSRIMKYKKQLIGSLIGATIGALYYRFVGCKSGTCMITSNVFILVPYSALLGYLFVGIFTSKKETKGEGV